MLHDITFGVETTVEPFLEKLLQIIVDIITGQMVIDAKSLYNEVNLNTQQHSKF